METSHRTGRYRAELENRSARAGGLLETRSSDVCRMPPKQKSELDETLPRVSPRLITISLSSVPSICAGVAAGAPLGARIPHHCTASKSETPISAMVGTSGNVKFRFRLRITNQRQLGRRAILDAAGLSVLEPQLDAIPKTVCGIDAHRYLEHPIVTADVVSHYA